MANNVLVTLLIFALVKTVLIQVSSCFQFPSLVSKIHKKIDKIKKPYMKFQLIASTPIGESVARLVDLMEFVIAQF